MLNKLALRLSVVRALRGQTLAGDNVLDSEYGAIDELAAEKPKPFILVYTDDAHYSVTGRDLYATSASERVDSGTQKLVIEIAITQRMKVDEDENGNPIEGAVPLVTDAALEFNIDLIERQVMDALMAPDNAWAEMWRRFALNIETKEVQRGISQRDGVRFAGRQITLAVSLPKDPPTGGAIGPLWAGFLALAANDNSLNQVLPAIEAVLTGRELSRWQVEQGAYGRNVFETKALLLDEVAV